MATSTGQSRLLPVSGAEQDLRASEISEIWQTERKVDQVRLVSRLVINIFNPSDLVNQIVLLSLNIYKLNMNFQSFESLFTVHEPCFCLKFCVFCCRLLCVIFGFNDMAKS